jgi:hypothetical protein
MYPTTPTDPPALVQARAEIKGYVQKWLSEAAAHPNARQVKTPRPNVRAPRNARVVRPRAHPRK